MQQQYGVKVQVRPGDMLIGTAQAARYLGVSPRTMRRFAKALKLGIKVGGHWKYPRNAVVNVICSDINGRDELHLGNSRDV